MRNLFLFITILGLLTSVFAEGVEMKTKVDKSEIYLGDKLQYDIIITFPDSQFIELPGVLGNLGAFEVKEFEVSEPKKHKDGKIQSWTFELSTFLSGDYVIPPQLVEVHQAGKEAVKLYTEPVKIKVLTRNAEDVTDILDIEGPLNQPKDYTLYMIIGGAVLLLALIIYLVTSRKVKYVYIPPDKEALINLQKLEEKSLLESGLYQQHYFELTNIFKTYVSKRFNVDAMESTSQELLNKVHSISEVKGKLDEDLNEFCQLTDLAKYAKRAMDDESNARMNDYVKSFVENTKPLDEKKEAK